MSGQHSEADVTAGLGKYAAEKTQRSLPSFVEAIEVVSAGLGIKHFDLEQLLESVFPGGGYENGSEIRRYYLAYRFLRERGEVSTEFLVLRPPAAGFPSIRFATWFLDGLHNVCEENGVVLASSSQMFGIGQVKKKSCLTFSAFALPLARRTRGSSLALRVSASPSTGMVILEETQTIKHSDQAGLARIDYRKFRASSDLPESLLRELEA